MTIHKTIIMALVATSSMALQAQESYSLDECISMAREHNINIRTAQNNLSASSEQRKEAFTNYFPTVSATGMGFTANKGLVAMELQPGMELEMVKNGIVGSVSAIQPVFAGGQIINGNRLAKVGEEVSRIQLSQTDNEVVLTTEQYYWQVVMLHEKMHTIDVVDSMLAQIQHDVEVAVSAGVAMRNDLLQVQLKRNELEANRTNLNSGLALSRMLLAQYIGATQSEVEPNSSIAVGEMPQSPLELRVDHQSALASTNEYQLLQRNVDASVLQRKLAVGKNLPTLGVGAGYSYNNLMDKDRTIGMVFASIQVPLSGWWGGSHAIKRSKIAESTARNQLEDNSELLVIKMQNAWNELDNAYQQLSIACRSIEQSSENLRLNTDYYHAGTTTMSDLLDAEMLYQQSRDKFVEAFTKYQTKRTEYLQATGRY